MNKAKHSCQLLKFHANVMFKYILPLCFKKSCILPELHMSKVDSHAEGSPLTKLPLKTVGRQAFIHRNGDWDIFWKINYVWFKDKKKKTSNLMG